MLIGLDRYKSMLLEKLPDINSSLILNGSKGVGKFSLISEVLSEMVNNTDNIHIIKSEEGKSQINVEQIRELFETINLMPYNDTKHYIIIDNAEQLNDVSFNLLLKRLEEPKPTEMFILITSDLDKIATTIKSRCLIINIALDSDVIQSHMDKIENETIKKVLLKLGFSHIIEYINNDAVKSKYEDAYKFGYNVLSISSRKQIGTISKQFIKDVKLNMEMLLALSDNSEYIHKTYDLIQRDVVNTQILIDIMLYHLIETNKPRS